MLMIFLVKTALRYADDLDGLRLLGGFDALSRGGPSQKKALLQYD
jgi:hypothetical protein